MTKCFSMQMYCNNGMIWQLMIGNNYNHIILVRNNESFQLSYFRIEINKLDKSYKLHMQKRNSLKSICINFSKYFGITIKLSMKNYFVIISSILKQF